MSDKNEAPNQQPGYAHPYQGRFQNQGGPGPLWWAFTPGFHPLKVVVVIAAFAIFHPLGIVLLAWFIFNAIAARRHGWSHGPYAFSSAGGSPDGRSSTCRRGHRTGRSGNTAFDEHSAKVMSDLEQESRDFAAAREAERNKRDLEAFEAFKAAKAKGDTPPSTSL